MALTQIKTDAISDDAVTLAKQAAGTDGQVITYDASGNPTAVGPGTDGQVLTSTGAGSPPAFEDAAAGVGGATGLDLNDNISLRLGTDNDLSFYHDGSVGRLYNTTGSIVIRSDDYYFKDSTGNDDIAKFIEDGAVELYHNNAKKLSTGAEGITVFSAAPYVKFDSTSYDCYVGAANSAGNLSNGSVAGHLVLRGETGISLSGNNGTASQVKITADGLLFGTDTAAANALDDYEEGTWTCTPQDGGASSNASSTTVTGYYTKIGRSVTAHARLINISTTGLTAGNDIHLAGLPFTGSIQDMVGSCSIHANIQSDSWVTAVYMNGTNYCKLYENRDNYSRDYVEVSELVDGQSDIFINITYFAD